MSELRQRMIDLMVFRNYAESTIEMYVRNVEGLARYYNRCPSQLSREEVQGYLVYLSRDRALAYNTVNVAAMGARFLYREVLDRSQEQFHLPPRKAERRLPVVLSIEDTRRLINAPDRIKHRAILHTIYGCGLRLSELRDLEIADIDSAHMRIRIEQSKGRKDRYTMLPKSTLKILRDYYRAERPVRWLFNGRVQGQQISGRRIEQIYQNAREKAGIPRRRGRGVHTLRHCFASHHLAEGTDLLSIQKMMGHKNLATTERYLHLMPERWGQLRSPADG
jgi:site-specific recombinase XerD